MDEIYISPDCCRVTPTPVPAWWSRLGELHEKHVHEHPLWDPDRRIKCNQVVAFSDFDGDQHWKLSTLYNEYYVNLGVRCQLGVQIKRTDTEAVCLAFSRGRRDFAPEDRALVELLSPHIATARRNVIDLAAACERREEPIRASGPNKRILVVGNLGKTILLHTTGAMALLREFFDHDTGVGAGLPDEVRRWLQLRKEWLRRDALAPGALSPLVLRRGRRKLSIRLACLRFGEATLLLECSGTDGNHTNFGPTLAILTPREREILHWAGEGKRNSEIAIILGISYRTVEKHFEHILTKLGVETRTGAIRHASESPNGHHA